MLGQLPLKVFPSWLKSGTWLPVLNYLVSLRVFHTYGVKFGLKILKPAGLIEKKTVRTKYTTRWDTKLEMMDWTYFSLRSPYCPLVQWSSSQSINHAGSFLVCRTSREWPGQQAPAAGGQAHSAAPTSPPGEGPL